MKTLESVEADAWRLPQDKRLTLAHRLLASVEPAPLPDVETTGQETEGMTYEFVPEAQVEFSGA